MDRKDPHTLLAYQRAEHELAEICGRIASWLDYALLTAAITGVLFPTIGAYIAIAGLLLGSGRWLASDMSRSRQQVAERARRAVVLHEGLGIELSGKAFTDLHNAFSVSEKQARRHFVPAYYGSKLNPGPKRLSELLEECSYWSKALCETAAKWAWVKFVLALALAILTVVLLIFENAQQTRAMAVEVFYIVVATLVTGGLFTRAVDFTRAANQLDDIEGRIPLAPDSVDEVLPILGDYNAVVLCIPVIPSRVYHERRDNLNLLWRARKGG